MSAGTMTTTSTQVQAAQSEYSSTFEWHCHARLGSYCLANTASVDMDDYAATSVEVAPTSLRADMPFWNGKLETLPLFQGSLNAFFSINKGCVTRFQAIYLTIQALPLQFQMEVMRLHFSQYYEVLSVLRECYYRIQLSKLRCRSSSSDDILDYLVEHLRLYQMTDSVTGSNGQDMLREGLPNPYKPPIKGGFTRKEHIQAVELMIYHLKYKSSEAK
ncbi:hypothetical protein TRVA0_013S00144 [Trichomonascus vanleenenianus]|uniref:uncharacterized protein n=1 Tax=Trichomonascus vanleenenianus TaxID=2268995 RepID=UPI003ECA51D7